jgi:hypothetical protein
MSVDPKAITNAVVAIRRARAAVDAMPAGEAKTLAEIRVDRTAQEFANGVARQVRSKPR